MCFLYMAKLEVKNPPSFAHSYVSKQKSGHHPSDFSYLLTFSKLGGLVFYSGFAARRNVAVFYLGPFRLSQLISNDELSAPAISIFYLFRSAIFYFWLKASS